MVVVLTQKKEAQRLDIFKIDSHCEINGNSKCLEHKLQSKAERKLNLQRCACVPHCSLNLQSEPVPFAKRTDAVRRSRDRMKGPETEEASTDVHFAL